MSRYAEEKNFNY